MLVKSCRVVERIVTAFAFSIRLAKGRGASLLEKTKFSFCTTIMAGAFGWTYIKYVLI